MTFPWHPLSWNRDTGEFRLEQPERIDCYEVPAGFVHDFASIPRVLRVWLNPWSPKIGPASVVHDWLYVEGKAGRTVLAASAPPDFAQMSAVLGGVRVLHDRRSADREFHRILRSYGVGRLQAAVMYLAVRAFGWVYWRREAYERITGAWKSFWRGLGEIGRAYERLIWRK